MWRQLQLHSVTLLSYIGLCSSPRTYIPCECLRQQPQIANRLMKSSSDRLWVKRKPRTMAGKPPVWGCSLSQFIDHNHQSSSKANANGAGVLGPTPVIPELSGSMFTVSRNTRTHLTHTPTIRNYI